MTRAIIRKQNPVISRLVEIGRCRKGTPKGTSVRKWEGGDDYASHYIRFEPEERLKLHPASTDDYESLYDELKAAWDQMMAQGHIKIRFPHATIAENFPYSNKLIKKIGSTEKTFRECDGQTCTRWTEDGKHPTNPNRTIPVFKRGSIPCSAIEGKSCPMGCAPWGMLKFMVPDFYPGGVILFPLSSPVDISAIAGYLEPYQNYDLSAIPFNLFRREDSVSWEEKGEMKQGKNWGLHIGVDPTITRLMMESKSRNFITQLEGGSAIAPLPPAPVNALPPAQERLPDFSRSDDGMIFKAAVSKAIRNGSLQELEGAIDNALELIFSEIYDESGRAFVERQEQNAREAIRDAQVAIAVKLPPQPKAAPIVKPDPVTIDVQPDTKETGQWEDVQSPIALDDLIAQISVQIERVGWTKKQGSVYLVETYGKKTRAELKDDELEEFHQYLSLLPDLVIGAIGAD